MKKVVRPSIDSPPCDVDGQYASNLGVIAVGDIVVIGGVAVAVEVSSVGLGLLEVAGDSMSQWNVSSDVIWCASESCVCARISRSAAAAKTVAVARDGGADDDRRRSMGRRAGFSVISCGTNAFSGGGGGGGGGDGDDDAILETALGMLVIHDGGAACGCVGVVWGGDA